MMNDERAYYEQRDRFNQLLAEGKGDCEESAALFYYLNRTGYNGLCRFNRSGGFNVPFGRYTQIKYSRDGGLEEKGYVDGRLLLPRL
jgi:DNA adenine methylase